MASRINALSFSRNFAYLSPVGSLSGILGSLGGGVVPGVSVVVPGVSVVVPGFLEPVVVVAAEPAVEVPVAEVETVAVVSSSGRAH